METKGGQLIRRPTPSKFQHDIFAAYEWLVANEQPVRIIAAPKARQSYGSTTVCHLCYHHTRRFHSHGLMMADEGDRTKKIWAMFQRFAQHDDFRPFWDSRYEGNTEECRFHFRDADGSKRVATWEHETANDAAAGAAGTRQVLWFSEGMRYKREGDAADTKVIGNAINSMPFAPGTAVFIESTAEGPSGYAFGIHRGAVTLAERIAGNFGNGWVKIFCAWHECGDYRLDRNQPASAGWFDDANPQFARFDEREKAGRIRFGWTAEQIAWRRQKIVGDLNGDEELFDRDFPESEEVAFQSSSSQRFNVVGLARLSKMVETAEAGYALRKSEQRLHLAPYGLWELVEQHGKVREVAAHDTGWLWLTELPIPGCRYIAFCDPMTGEQSEGSKERDTHSAGIIRDAYTDDKKLMHNAEVVAVLHHPGACRWDNDILAERLTLLTKLFGHCLCICEANNSGTEVMRLLLLAGVDLWRRRKRDDRNPGKELTVVGFLTHDSTKNQWIGELGRAIREETLDCLYGPAVSQFATFVLNERGTGEAQSGAHDDFVTGIGLGLLALPQATRMPVPTPVHVALAQHPRYQRETSVMGGHHGACS